MAHRFSIQRLRRNWPFVAATYDWTRAKEPTQREDAQRRLVSWVGRKLVDRIRDAGLGAVKGFPAALLDQHPEYRRQLQSTDHLGVLAPLRFSAATRFDYVCAQWSNLLKIKRTHPGLGLGSARMGQDSLEYHGNPLSALELLQLWALLLNVGHLFGTFATERGLLIHLHREHARRDEILAQVDERLRPLVQPILKEATIYQCANAIGAWKISRLDSPAERETCVRALQMYLCDSPSTRLQKLRWVFKRCRQFSYLQLHGSVGLGPQPGTAISNDELEGLFGHPVIRFQPHAPEEAAVADLLDGLDAFHYRSFFTSSLASRAVLRHLRELKAWWATRTTRGSDTKDLLESLLEKPADWPNIETDLTPVVTLELPVPANHWLNEMERWHANGGPWKSCNFLITHLPMGETLICDLYARNGHVCPAVAHHVGGRLAEHVVSSWSGDPTEQSRRLWRSVALFGAALFQECLKNGVRIVVEPYEAGAGSVGYATIAGNVAGLLERLHVVATRLASKERALEVRAICSDIEAVRPSGPVLVFLGKTILIGGEDKEIHEIDGLWADLTEAMIHWHALEVKGGLKTSGIVGQLAGLSDHLSIAVPEPVVRHCPDGKIGRVSFTWPDGQMPNAPAT